MQHYVATLAARLQRGKRIVRSTYYTAGVFAVLALCDTYTMGSLTHTACSKDLV